MSSSAVTQKPTGAQKVAKPGNEPLVQREEKEASASGSASAGLNLNIFGAISGAFSGKSKKEHAKDGSEVETREETSHIQGLGVGNAKAAGVANAEAKSREEREKIMAR